MIVMLIHAQPLSAIGTERGAISRYALRGNWADRRQHYDARAAYDFDFYAWLEQRARLPKPGDVPSAADERDFIACTRPNRAEVGRMPGTRRNGAVKVLTEAGA